jgi:protocatechuate 3,4-dioxygenase beta subunit
VKRKHVVAVVVLAAIAIGLWLYLRGDDPAAQTQADKPAATSPASRARIAIAQEQVNVGERAIGGIVLFEGKPLAGATVRLSSRVTKLERTSDSAGRFDFGPLPAAIYNVTADKPKLTSAWQWIDLRHPRPFVKPDEMRLVLHACTASLFGIVRDAASGVIAGAHVGPTPDSGVETNAAGEYELCVDVGSQRVVVTADGYATHHDSASAYGRLRRDFALVPEAIVAGRVVRASDRSAVPNALVTVRRDYGTEEHATADDQGRFRIVGLEAGTYAVTARAERLASARPALVTAEMGEPGDEVLCTVEDAFRVAGKLVADGEPVAGMTINLSAIEPQQMRSFPLNAITQPDGTFVIDHVVPGEYRLSISGVEFTTKPANVVVKTADVNDIALEIEKLGSISGRLTRNGKPVDSTWVRATSERGRGSSGYANHDGRYEIVSLPAGTFETYAQSERDGVFTHGPTITLARGEHRTGVDLDLNLAGKISGKVVDQNGAPVANAYLRFSLLGGADYGAATTEQDGSFTAAALSGGGDYVYEVRASERSPVRFEPANGRRRFPPIAVRDGDTHVSGVVITVRRELLSIAGRVVDDDHRPLANVVVALDMPERGITMTGDDGAFKLDGLAPGTYGLHAQAVGRRTQLDDIAAGKQDLEILLSAPGSLEGTLEGFTSTPDIVVSTGSYGPNSGRYQATVTGNTFRVRSLPSGNYVVTAREKAGVATVRVTIKPGAPTTVTLAQRSFGTITGTLTDEATHKPIADAMCFAEVMDADDGDSAGDSARYQNIARARTDASGAFRLERVIAGDNHVMCIDTSSKRVQVVAGQATHVDLVKQSSDEAPPSARRAHLGFVLENQLSDVRVRSVEPNSPAARSGIAVGDIVVKVDDRAVERWAAEYLVDVLETSHVGRPAKLTLERNDKEQVIQLPIEAGP